MKKLKQLLNIDIEAIAVTVFIGGACFFFGFFMCVIIFAFVPAGY